MGPPRMAQQPPPQQELPPRQRLVLPQPVQPPPSLGPQRPSTMELPPPLQQVPRPKDGAAASSTTAGASSTTTGASTGSASSFASKQLCRIRRHAKFLERRALFSRLLRDYKDSGLKRPDLAAMKSMNHTRSSFKYEGLEPVPSIQESDVFVYLSEAVVVGLHRQVQRGIAYVLRGGERVATILVLSGGYIDDVDRYTGIIEYTGQGGNDWRGSKHQISDQSLDAVTSLSSPAG